MRKDLLVRMKAPADFFVGTGAARPISVRNVIAFSRIRARDLGARRSFHHRFVLCFNLRGSASLDLVLNGVAVRLSPERYILFLPHQMHTYTGLDDREIAVLFVTFETDEGDLLYHLSERVMEITPAVEESISTFIETLAQGFAYRRKNREVLATQALLETIIANDRESGVDAVSVLPEPLKPALLLLSRGGSWTALSLAKRVGLSEAYLRKLFRKSMGVSLGRYLVELRQNRARSLLGASDESISRIAELCGYKSVYAFSRSFRAFNECTPSGYRERMRNPGVR